MSNAFSLHETAAQLEQQIRSRRLLDLPVDWADELVYPAYDGLSIRNVPHSIASMLGTSLPDNTPLDAAVWDGERFDEIDRVVLYLCDGLGYLYLQDLIAEDDEIREAVQQLTDGRGALPLTSVSPSTTAVALPTLWSGASPATHGMMGTLMFLREFSAICNMLTYAPQLTGRPGSLEHTGSRIKPEDFIPTQRLPVILKDQQVTTHVLLLGQYIGTGLSRILHRGVKGKNRHAHLGHSDLWRQLHAVLKHTAGTRSYVNIYHTGVDSLSHKYGARNAITQFEVKSQFKELLAVLNCKDVQDGRTLFLLLTDHGHADAPQHIDLAKDDSAAHIYKHMRTGLTGDMRMGYLNLQEGAIPEVKKIIAENFADQLTAIASQEALQSGLFGTEPHAPQTRYRIGDVILIPRLGVQVEDSSVGKLNLTSVHSGLSADEMLVPLIWKRM